MSDSGNAVYLNYDEAFSQIRIHASVKENTYMAIGFGTGMTGTDMVFFKGDGVKQVTDMWSSGNFTPSTDAQ